jgi:sugar transferase EpsL
VYAAFFKRAVDLIFASFLLILLLPVMTGVALVVWLVDGSPILFCDERSGLNGVAIWILKFRSMRVQGDGGSAALPDGERLTVLGRFLRRSSLDELPQLWSVIRGDMSLVGPRPLPLRYVPRYNARQATRLLVRPGLTGWAQIHGRNAVDWPRRLEYDAQYVELLRSPTAPLTDLWIVAATVVQILFQAVTGRGISAAGAATMQEFKP